MMTLYLLFEALESGKASLDLADHVSAHAAAQAPSKLGLKPGQTIKVRDAILALVTKSANDVAVAIGEHLGRHGSRLSPRHDRARPTNSACRTPCSTTPPACPIPARSPPPATSPTLGRALQEHYPSTSRYFSTRSFVWNGRRIGNHNHLLGKVDGVDGIKTGYTRASGFNLVTSVKRGNRKIVAVVIGGETAQRRATSAWPS